MQNLGALEGFNQAEEAERARMAQRQMALRQQQAAEQQAAFQNSLAARQQFGNEGAQRYAQDMGLRQQGVAEGAQRYGEDMGLRQQGVAEGAQRYGEDMGLFNNFMNMGNTRFSQDMGARSMLGNEMDRRFAQQNQNRARQIAEARLLRQQPMSDLASLLAGVSPGGIPQMPQYAQYAIQAPDYMGLVGSSYAARAGRPSGFGSTLSGLGGLASGIGALGGLFSDRRLKEDIERVGELAPGVGLYVYRYRGNPTSFMGAMADEVEQFAPEAVGDYAGVKTVNYRTLARKLRQVGEVSEREAA